MYSKRKGHYIKSSQILCSLYPNPSTNGLIFSHMMFKKEFSPSTSVNLGIATSQTRMEPIFCKSILSLLYYRCSRLTRECNRCLTALYLVHLRPVGMRLGIMRDNHGTIL